MHFILKTGKQEPACQHFHHEVHEEKKKWTLNTITIGKQLINRIGAKATHPPTFTISSLRGSASDAAIQSEPPPQESPATLHSTTPPPHPLSLRATKWRGNPAEPVLTRDYLHSLWIAASGLAETLLAMTSETRIEKSLDPTCKLQEAPREAFLIPACELLQLPRDVGVRPKWHPPPLRDRQGNRSCLRACMVPSARSG